MKKFIFLITLGLLMAVTFSAQAQNSIDPNKDRVFVVIQDYDSGQNFYFDVLCTSTVKELMDEFKAIGVARAIGIYGQYKLYYNSISLSETQRLSSLGAPTGTLYLQLIPNWW